MTPDAAVSKIQKTFPEIVQEVIRFHDEITLVVDRASIVDVCTFMRDDPDLAFNYLSDLSAVDIWPEHPRFQVNIQLTALDPRPQPGQGVRRLRVKVRLEEHDAKMSTLSGVWPSSAWYERETHDLFGIEFTGHPDLRPLLLPKDSPALGTGASGDDPPPLRRDIPVHVEEVAFSFNQERIYRNKPFAKE